MGQTLYVLRAWGFISYLTSLHHMTTKGNDLQKTTKQPHPTIILEWAIHALYFTHQGQTTSQNNPTPSLKVLFMTGVISDPGSTIPDIDALCTIQGYLFRCTMAYRTTSQKIFQIQDGATGSASYAAFWTRRDGSIHVNSGLGYACLHFSSINEIHILSRWCTRTTEPYTRQVGNVSTERDKKQSVFFDMVLLPLSNILYLAYIQKHKARNSNIEYGLKSIGTIL